MNTKTFFTAILVASLATIAGQARAADNPDKAPQSAPQQASTITRAEVLADLQIYRESGLAAAELPESFGTDSDRRAKAQAKYAQLRNSAYYATLVKRYGGGDASTAVAVSR